MKNKITTYVLLVAVLGIWGYVVYKIIHASQSDEAFSVIHKEKITVNEDLSYYTVKKLDSLNLNFRDPIYHKEDKNQSIQPATIETENNSIQNDYNYNQPVLEPEIQIIYLGFIENEQTKRKTAMLQIEDKQYMLGLHEGINGVKLLDIKGDYIRIQHKNKVKTIFK